jgi:hypothetical protein
MPTDQATQDAEHLRLLSIFHYVVAGMQALFATFPIFHFLIGAAIVFAPGRFGAPNRSGPPVDWMGWFFMLFAGAWMLIGWTLAICLVVAAKSLKQRKRHLFCIIIAGIEAAMCMPFGTVLGVFTIIVLIRPSVKDLFDQAGLGNIAA